MGEGGEPLLWGVRVRVRVRVKNEGLGKKQRLPLRVVAGLSGGVACQQHPDDDQVPSQALLWRTKRVTWLGEFGSLVTPA